LGYRPVVNTVAKIHFESNSQQKEILVKKEYCCKYRCKDTF
jgi:hypothetical protein